MTTGSAANLAAVERAALPLVGGRALVLRGARSSGRTTLLEHAADTVAGHATVVRGAGAAAEASLPFALLHQLLVPYEALVPELPGPQATALTVALRLTADPPDPAAAGSGLRSLLVRLAQRRPVLVLVDDVDLADAASADALGFAARRLAGAPISLLLTSRPRLVPPSLGGLPTWDLRPLSPAEATAVVAEETGGACPDEVATVLATASDGLPGELRRLAALLAGTADADQAEQPTPPPADARRAVPAAWSTSPGRDALLLRTAVGAWRRGATAPAMRLVARLSDDASACGEVRRLQGLFELRCGAPTIASDLLVGAAAGLPPAAALQALVEAGEAALYAGDAERMRAIAERARTLEDQAPVGPGGSPQLAFLEGVTATLAGRPADGLPLLRITSRAGGAAVRPQAVLLAGLAAIAGGDAAVARVLLTRAIQRAPAGGADGIVPGVLALLAVSEALLGRYRDATAHVRDGLGLARALEHPTTEANLLAAQALTDAFRGTLGPCRQRADEALQLAVAHGLDLAGATAEWALGVADLATGDVAAAGERLGAVATGENGTGHPLIALLSAPHRAEAAVRAGRPDVAHAALDAFHPFAAARRQPWAGALALRIRALLAVDPAEADQLYARAHLLHARAGRPHEHARTLYLWGVRLRTDHQRAAAATRIRSATALLAHLGEGAWTTLAQAELRALEGPGPPTDPGEHPTLTAREREIVDHVRRGATNREIAGRLFLSPRTVDHHLRNVFRKLGIRSRAELLDERPSLAPPPGGAGDGARAVRVRTARSPISP